MWWLFSRPRYRFRADDLFSEFFSEGKGSLSTKYQDIYTKVFAAINEVWFNKEPKLIVGYR
jgi:hypothetical protein